MISLLTLNALDVCGHFVVFRNGVPHPVQDTTGTQNCLPGRTEPCGRCSCSFIILTLQHNSVRVATAFRELDGLHFGVPKCQSRCYGGDFVMVIHVIVVKYLAP